MYLDFEPPKNVYNLSKAATKFQVFFVQLRALPMMVQQQRGAAAAGKSRQTATAQTAIGHGQARTKTRASKKELERQWPTNIFVKLAMLLPTALAHI